MMTKWRVIKKAVVGQFNYIGVEFSLENGLMEGIKVKDADTVVRKRSTSQFEALENDEWIGLNTKEAPNLLKDFNIVRRAEGLPYITEQEVLKMLYRINSL